MKEALTSHLPAGRRIEVIRKKRDTKESRSHDFIREAFDLHIEPHLDVVSDIFTRLQERSGVATPRKLPTSIEVTSFTDLKGRVLGSTQDQKISLREGLQASDQIVHSWIHEVTHVLSKNEKSILKLSDIFKSPKKRAWPFRTGMELVTYTNVINAKKTEKIIGKSLNEALTELIATVVYIEFLRRTGQAQGTKEQRELELRYLACYTEDQKYLFDLIKKCAEHNEEVSEETILSALVREYFSGESEVPDYLSVLERFAYGDTADTHKREEILSLITSLKEEPPDGYRVPFEPADKRFISDWEMAARALRVRE